MFEGIKKENIQKLADETGSTKEKIQEIIIGSFRSAYCSYENKGAELHFDFKEDFKIYRLYKIVEKFSDHQKEVASNSTLIESFKKDKKRGGKVENGVFFFPIEIRNLSRLLNQKIRENIEKELAKISQKKIVQNTKIYKGNWFEEIC